MIVHMFGIVGVNHICNVMEQSELYHIIYISLAISGKIFSFDEMFGELKMLLFFTCFSWNPFLVSGKINSTFSFALLDFSPN